MLDRNDVEAEASLPPTADPAAPVKFVCLFLNRKKD